MCGGGNKTTTTATQTPSPQALGYFNQAFGLASNVAQTPTSAVPRQGTADLNDPQKAGINQTGQYSQYAIPYANQALGMLTGAAQPLTDQQIQQYENPYVSSVVGATQKQFDLMNKQALENIKGNAAAQGALGGDRASSVAPAAYYGAVLPGQEQAIAGLYNNAYGQAVSTAQNQFQNNPQQAAFGLGSIANMGQNAGLQGAAAQFGAGNIQQQYGPGSQAALNALYQQNLGQFQLPFQESQLLTQAAGGLGPLYGGTSTTQAPPPNLFSQIAGLGLGAAGLGLAFGHKDGGAVGYDSGGVIPFANQSDLIQIAPMSFHGSGIPAVPKAVDTNAPFQQIGQEGMQLAQLANKSGGSGNLFGKVGAGYNNMISGIGGAWNDLTNPPLSLAPPGQSTGGFVSGRDPNGIYLPQGFADGGVPDWMTGAQAPAAPLFTGWPNANADVSLNGPETASLGLGKDVAWTPDQNAAVTAYAPGGNGTARNTAAIPSALTRVADNGATTAGSVIPSLAPPTTPIASNTTQPQSTTQEKGAFGIPRDAALALAAAGFGIAGGSSPYAGINIGRGAETGLQAYQAEQKQRISVEQEAKKLAQQADQFQQSLAQREKLHMAMTPFQKAELEKPFPVGANFWGQQQYLQRRINPQTGQIEWVTPQIGQQGQQPSASAPSVAPQGTPTEPGGAAPRLFKPDSGYRVLDVSSTPADPKTGEVINANYIMPTEAKTDQAVQQGNFDRTQFPQGVNPEVLAAHPEHAGTIKMMAEGRLPWSPRYLQGPQAPAWQQILQWTAQYDPSFDANNYGARGSLRKQYLGGGPTAQRNQSQNMAIGHLGSYLQDVDELSAYLSTHLPETNALRDWWYKHDPKYQEIKAHIDTHSLGVAQELNKVFKGTGTPSETEAAKWLARINPLESPVYQRSVGKAAMDMLEKRIASSGDTWNQGMGPGQQRDPLSWLSPEARSTYDRIQKMDPQKGLGGTPQQQGQPQQSNSPQVGEVRKGYQFLGGDPGKPESWKKVQ